MQFSAFAQCVLAFNQSDFDAHQCQTEVSFQVLHSLVQSYRDQVGMFYKLAYIGRQSLSPGHKTETEVYQLKESDFATKKARNTSSSVIPGLPEALIAISACTPGKQTLYQKARE